MIIEYNGGNLSGECLAFFYASWSSRCNLHDNALKRIEYENKGLKILRINTSKYHILKEKFTIKKIPTFILLNDDNIVSRVDGYTDQYSLCKWIKNYRS